MKSDYTQSDLVAYFQYNAELDNVTSYGDDDLTFPDLIEYQNENSRIIIPGPHLNEIIYSCFKI